MKRITLVLALSTLISSQAYANPSHPASKEWVLEQLAALSAASSLSAADWLNLCPKGQSIDSSTGCTPNCQGAQKAACSKLLDITEVEDQTLLSSTAATGMTVFRLTVQPTFTSSSPLFTNGSTTNNVRCQMFTLHGTLLNNLNDNFPISGSSSQSSYQTYTAGVDLQPSSAVENDLLEFPPDAGAQRLNQQYYVICLAYTATANIATNVNMDHTLSITWS